MGAYKVTEHVSLYEKDENDDYLLYMDYTNTFLTGSLSEEELKYILTRVFKENRFNVNWNEIESSTDGKAFRVSRSDRNVGIVMLMVVLTVTDDSGNEYVFPNRFSTFH